MIGNQSRPDLPEFFSRYTAAEKHLGGLSLSPEGTRLAFLSNGDGRFNIHLHDFATGRRQQLSRFTHGRVTAALWRDEETLLGMHDPGDERTRIFSITLDGAQPTFLTSGGRLSRFGPGGLSPDGNTLAYCVRTESGAMDVRLLDLVTGKARTVRSDGSRYLHCLYGPEASALILVAAVSNTERRLRLLDLISGRCTPLLPATEMGHAMCYAEPLGWTRSGEMLLLTDQDHDFVSAVELHPATGELTQLIKVDGDVEHLAASADDELRAWVINERGHSRLYARIGAGQAHPLTPELHGMIEALAVDRDGHRIVVRINSYNKPAHLVSYEVDAVGRARARPVTDGCPARPPESIVLPESLRIESTSNPHLSGWLYRPSRSEGRVPLVVALHGGPQRQERPRYNPLYQRLCALGIGVLAPNVRGSTGLGRTYQNLIRGDWGGGDVADLAACVLAVTALEWVDRRQIAVLGLSYGGYLALCSAGMGFDWAAVVAVGCPVDLIRYTARVPPAWRDEVAASIGDPERDGDRLRARSPVNLVHRMSAPVCLIYGERDGRVSVRDAAELRDRLGALGRSAELHVLPGEGHGIDSQSGQVEVSRIAIEFFLEHLARSEHGQDKASRLANRRIER